MNSTMSKIEKYFSGTSMFPLLVVVSPDEYLDTLRKFSDMPRLKVSDYCVDADKDPDTDKLREDVKGLKGNYLLIGLGDYLASKGKAAKNLLIPYKDMTLQFNSHVVIILSSHMYPVLKEILRDDLRVKSRIILPDATPQIPEVHSTGFVYGIKAYLDACEKGESVGNVKTGRKMDGVKVINPDNAFDELKSKYKPDFDRLSHVMGANEYWGKLLDDMNKTKKNLLQYLQEQNFTSPEYVFLRYAKTNDYKAWLYFLWLKLQKNNQNYLDIVIAKTDNLVNLFSIAKTAILDIKTTDNNFNKFYEQRKILLHDCTDADMADFVPKIYQYKDDKIAYLTDNTKIERQQIIISLCDGAEAKYIKNNYYDLYCYLQDYKFNDDNLTRYFVEYKKCKISNKIACEFTELVKHNAIARPYNSLSTRTSIFSNIGTDKTILIFLDALGVEFLGYILALCTELKLRCNPIIARANLPTITAVNREFYDDWQGGKEPPIKRLDDLKHHPECGYDFNNSPFPIYLSEELEAVRAALERAKIKLSTGEYRKVIIASDHGASRLAVLSDDVQIENNGCESKSSGRYCQGEDLPVATNIALENNCAVIADYSRFMGSRAASVEVHGGATLEEIIVPIIELTLADANIQVILENNVIEITYKKIPEVILLVTPDCDGITASVNGIVYQAEKIGKSRFRIVMPDLKKGVYNLDVFENQNKISSNEFTIKSKGLTERNIF